ncbi:hypothetical protein [Nonomuraea africana]|uniref:Lipoprotein n=1 Tax=Nonomuraea africana TaxID=46171 RepID=A0ABR9KT60_9ACTN|nr:hypothetical protein [Nonomuraea africana]MBE1565223.1 hypothetical protein [Nonomuraea africana]
MRNRGTWAVALPMALALTACGAPAEGGGVAGANGGTAAPASSSAAPTDPREAELKFAQCMREHGVDMPDPEPGGGIRIETRKGEEQKSEKAQKACQQFLRAAVGDPGKTKPDQKKLDETLKWVQCMRENGADMPDPSPDGRVELSWPQGTSEQKIKKIEEACNEFAPGPLKRS